MINKGYSCQVSEDIWVNHPMEHNKSYHSWKVHQCQSSRLDFDDDIQRAEEYFKQ